MRLANLLAELNPEELSRLAAEHVQTDETPAPPLLRSNLEGILRSFAAVNDFVSGRQPPAFAILTQLLEAPGNRIAYQALRESAMARTDSLCRFAESREFIGRDDQVYIYRRVLYEARRNDLDIDPSERAILGVLRRELGIAQVEHFLIEHHANLREFWESEDCFTHELHALRSAGLIFVREEEVLLPEDVAPLVQQALGIEMSGTAARRLFQLFTSSELADSLYGLNAKTSGSKEEKVERLIANWVQPRSLLAESSLGKLRDLCREVNAPSSGHKEDVIERLISHFAGGFDQVSIEEVPEEVREDRALNELKFTLLFGSLTGRELADVLTAFPNLRQSGPKGTRVSTLWAAQRSEVSLLSELMNRQLEDILYRLELKLGGSKRQRIERIINHFAGHTSGTPPAERMAHLDDVKSNSPSSSSGE